MSGPHSELALGELSAFELGREAVAATQEAEFSIAGQADLDAAGCAVTAGVLGADGAALATFAGQTDQRTQFGAQGSAQVQFAGAAYGDSGFTAAGGTDTSLTGGYAQIAELTAEGVGAATFAGLSGIGFDISAQSSMSMESEATASMAVSMVGSADAELVGQALVTSQTDMAGAAGVDAQGGSYNDVACGIDGLSHVAGRSQPYAMAGAQLAGSAAVGWVGGALGNATAQPGGTSDFEAETSAYIVRHAGVYLIVHADAAFVGQALRTVSTVAAMAGAGVTDYRGQAAADTQMHAVGSAFLDWLSGKPVLASMPFAFHVVERGQEVRDVARPEENRVYEVIEQ